MTQHNSLRFFNSVADINSFFGVTTHHPLVSVINLSELNEVNHAPKQFGVHSIACYWDSSSTEALQHDTDKCALLSFHAPGHYGKYKRGKAIEPKGYILAFDKVLLNKYAGTEVKVDGEEYQIIRQSDILAIVE